MFIKLAPTAGRHLNQSRKASKIFNIEQKRYIIGSQTTCLSWSDHLGKSLNLFVTLLLNHNRDANNIWFALSGLISCLNSEDLSEFNFATFDMSKEINSIYNVYVDGIIKTFGRPGTKRATPPAQTAPITICPSAPIFQTLAR